MNNQQLNISDLNTIKGVMQYLNLTAESDLSFEVSIFDSNGEKVGHISGDGNRSDHHFYYPAPN